MLLSFRFTTFLGILLSGSVLEVSVGLNVLHRAKRILLDLDWFYLVEVVRTGFGIHL